MIYQRELQGEIETNSESFEYDDEGTIVDQKLFIGGDVYEHISLTKTDTGFVRKMIQDGIEVERLETSMNGDNWSNKFYLNNELHESQDYTFDEKNKMGETLIKNVESEILIKDTHDSNGKIILTEEYHKNGSLLTSTEITLEKGEIVKETVREFSPLENHFDRLYEYDPKGNMIAFEVRSSTGALDSFHKRKFDNRNRLIEEVGFSNGYFSGITGIHKGHDRFHFVYEYE